jgi:hypothetical protein
MKSYHEGKTCSQCGTPLGAHHFVIEKHTERMSDDLEVANVLSAEVVAHACTNEACCRTLESAVAQGLDPTYQDFERVGECSLCHESVDRTQPYVGLAAMHEREREGDHALEVQSFAEIAIFCARCQVPEFDMAAQGAGHA